MNVYMTSGEAVSQLPPPSRSMLLNYSIEMDEKEHPVVDEKG